MALRTTPAFSGLSGAGLYQINRDGQFGIGVCPRCWRRPKWSALVDDFRTFLSKDLDQYTVRKSIPELFGMSRSEAFAE